LDQRFNSLRDYGVRAAANNPDANQLPKGISDEALAEGIARSGYPVQGLVAEKLLSAFRVSEEWGFRDPESGDHRALDLHAWLIEEPPEGIKVQPLFYLLVECKRSDKPYVFFKAVTDRAPQELRLDGIGGEVSLRDPSGRGFVETPFARLFGIEDDPWFSRDIPIATSFAVAHPKGKNSVQLSGDEAYNNLVLPLCKALEYARGRAPRGDRKEYLFPCLHIPIAVIDAAMLLVEDPRKPEDPVLVPRLRVLRHEATDSRDSWARDRTYQIEIVHVDYVEEFIRELLSLQSAVSSASLRCEAILRAGGAIVPDLDHWTAGDAKPKS